VNRHERGVDILLAGEELFLFELGDRAFECAKLSGDFPKQRVVSAARKVDGRGHVLRQALGGGPLVEFPLEARLLLRKSSGLALIVPEIGRRGDPLELVEAGVQSSVVKDTPAE
jgi:hypothetical protein